MNPFNLPGPQYLLFYSILSILTIIVVRRVRRSRELPDPEGLRYFAAAPISDPYLIAFLRGGKDEVVRVAMVSLIDRGLLTVAKEYVLATDVGREVGVRKKIEQDILDFCKSGRDLKDLLSTKHFDDAAREYELTLQRMELLPNAEQKANRRSLYGWAVLVLLFFAVTKVVLAIMRGRTNLGFLILLAIIALIVTAASIFRRRTSKGDAFVSELRNVFQSLRLRAPQIAPGGATAELVLLTSVFGIAALPAEAYPWSRTLFPRADSTSGTTSSCGSSCGSGCGGGCGGGGCGGCGG